MREVLVLREAADEAEAAAIHYENEAPGLGQQFQQAFHDSLLLLAEDVVPLTAISATLTSKHVRRLVMRRFPFSLVVRQASNDLFEVVAVAHHSRRPHYWLNRLST